ncbi:unnamed protein product [Kluyveromyces dobzhanskii CBS 2104]|uniref:Pre-mRNA-splicing factor n=1 Tax=Kluyveromyces dobzhanskii CBS 2104 TaxID=1427455 RepID=A0A0A8L292_9SACH|nr:unnamed protein product [Kluyveromyces dobzhanskii CBS 2104]
MSGISISLKTKSKVKKKLGSKKKKVTLFDADDRNEKVTEYKITEIEKHEEIEREPLAIAPVKPLRSSLTAQSKSNVIGVEPIVALPKESEYELNSTELPTTNQEDIPEKTNEEEYEEVPVEGFGAALLRGMGWDPLAETNGRPEKSSDTQEKSHPELLGIGAKATSASNSLRTSFMPLIRRAKGPADE